VTLSLLGVMIVSASALASEQGGGAAGDGIIRLRAWGVPTGTGMSVEDLARLRIVEAFRKKHPNITLIPDVGLMLPGARTMDMVPLMQIAGDMPAHAMYVNFLQSDTYIRSKLLYPLDRYVERMLGLALRNGPNMELDEYLGELKKSPGYKTEIEQRIPLQCWKVMRRECPYGAECPYAKVNGGELDFEPTKKHYHIWAFPQGPLVMALFYRKDVFGEVGLPNRVPETMAEMFEWAKKLTNPTENRYGLKLAKGEVLSWSTLSFLYSMGGRLVDQDAEGNWRCTFDSEQAVEAYYYVARLFLEPFENEAGKWTSVVYTGDEVGAGEIKYGMFFAYLDQRFFAQYDPAQYGFGPAPKGPTGLRGSEFNSRMAGIYAGTEDKRLRDAAWEYIRFCDGPEARKIRAKVFVENGLGNYVQPELLEAAGYPEYVRRVPQEWIRAYKEALKDGVPEPYGRNCQMVYSYASKAVDQIIHDEDVKAAIRAGDAMRAKAIIRQILKERVRRSNEKMLNILTPSDRKFRNTVAGVVAVGILAIFTLLFRKVFKVFAEAQPQPVGTPRRRWQFGRYKWAYVMLIPAVGSIALWAYYPLARGTVMAFQDYNVRGFSEWIGMGNFANVLFDDEFWYAMWVSLKYAVLFALFGFTAPIALAVLLTTVPRGKILFRTIYYLPAVLSGVVVMFLWRGFYGSHGAVNEILNLLIGLVNRLPGVEFAEVHRVWLDEPDYALLCILLPVIWAGMGPGCLIYLAALKTIPEDIYEAADIDGAGILRKVFSISLPSIKALIMINFIGVMVGTIKGGSQFALAMTGGGPYTPYGQTEFVGLHIFWQAFGYLRFGQATAMAWVLGSMLVGFTVFQLQRLSRMEFKTAGGVT